MATKEQKRIAECIKVAYQQLSRMCDTTRTDVRLDLPRAFRELRDVCERQEKEHMAFGGRMLGHPPARRTTLATRTQYFVVRAILDNTSVTSALDAYQTRADKIIGGAIASAVGSERITLALSDARCLTFDTVDYARDLA